MSGAVFGLLLLLSKGLSGGLVNVVTAAAYGVSIAFTVAWAWSIRRRWGVVALAIAVVLTGAAVFVVNWSRLSPSAYYHLHRSEFAQIAQLAARSDPEQQTDYYGSALPPKLAHHSVMGSAGWVDCWRGTAQQRHAWFVPEWTGIPDDAGGYVYMTGGSPLTLTCDLYGRAARLSDGVDLGDGWFSV